MSTLTVSAMPRTFFLNDTPLPDPSPTMSVEQVRDVLTVAYPEIATASLKTETSGSTVRHIFTRSIGTKG